jgi:S-DNA-T family DNA segregation ATPase FtsK/SpoIIIE
MRTQWRALRLIPNPTPCTKFIALVPARDGDAPFSSRIISYTPRDVPEWFKLGGSVPANRHALNFIGPVGAIVACVAYFFLGAAAYLRRAAARLRRGNSPCAEVTVDSALAMDCGFYSFRCGACAFAFYPLIGAQRLDIAGEGGLLGKWIGDGLFRNAVGNIGALILLSAIYLISLILMTGIHPVAVVRRVVGMPMLCINKYRG